jgi:putative transcription factor
LNSFVFFVLFVLVVMPSRNFSGGQDLAPQTFNFGPRPASGANRPKKLSENEASAAFRTGNVAVVKKEHLAFNNHTVGAGANAKKLDEDNETLKVKHVDPKISAMIQRVRQQKGLKQDELARLINERPSIVTEYENGKAIPNEQVLVRLEKALGIYLRGTKAGQPREDKKPAPKQA